MENKQLTLADFDTHFFLFLFIVHMIFHIKKKATGIGIAIGSAQIQCNENW